MPKWLQRAQITCLISFLLLVLACQEQQPKPTPANATATHQLPEQCVLDAKAERGIEGEIYFVGSTNLPDGMKIGVEILQGSRVAGQDFSVLIKDGRFRSTGFTSGASPYPPGKYKVHFVSSLNNLWQSSEILALVGQRGERLHGEMFRRTDPDVVDSPVVLDYNCIVVFPSLSPEAQAIMLVKRARLTVPGQSCTAQEVQRNIDDMEKLTFTLGLVAGKSISWQAKHWKAQPVGDRSYTVTFHFVETGSNVTGDQQATWSVDLATRRVKYSNLLAKTFSCIPQ